MSTMTVYNVRVWNGKTKQFQTVDVLLDIDTRGLAQHLANRGIRNKSRKSKIQDGLITATTIERAT